MFHPKGLKPSQEARETPIVGRALCLTPKDSPGLGRVSHLSEKFQDSLTMFSDTDELVAKISAMFPTVSHTHIRILLKKYYNREAVVISALQVEKHPIATPGPLTMSPSTARLQIGAGPSNMGMLPAIEYPGPSCSRNQPRLGAPQGSSPGRIMTSGYIRGMRQRQSDNQTGRHSSPKMKLKYLKSVYPKADEMFVLEVLANNDNNIQMAGQDLEAMGFVKKERGQPKNKEFMPQPPKKVVLIRNVEDRNQLFTKIQRKYWSVPERLIQIALESVDYNEERADHILMALLKERTSPMLNPPDDQRPRRSSLIELPDAAWFPNEGRVSSLQARPAEPMHAPTLAEPQVSPLALPPFAPPVIPAVPTVTAPAPVYGPVAAPPAPVAMPPVPVYVPSAVHAHMAANASAHMAAYAQQQPQLPAHVLAFGPPPVPIFPPRFGTAFAPMQAQAHVRAHALAQAQAQAQAQAHAQAFAQARAHAHAQAQAVAAAAPPTAPAPPAPDTRRPKQWNEHVKAVVKSNTAQPEPNTYQSQYNNAPAGPNPAIRQGPQDNLLLEDYMPWNGPNPELRRGQTARPEWSEQPAIPFPLARGPSGLAQGPSGLARGPSGLARGPSGRAQGSVYRNRQRGKK